MEPARCALTAIHFPEQRTLIADDNTAEPLPALLQQLAATAQALEDHGDCRIGATPADGDDAHGPAAAPRYRPSLQDASESLQGHERNAKESTAGEGPAVERSEDATHLPVRYHAAGHDPVWLLLYAVQVKLAQAQLNGMSQAWMAADLASRNCSHPASL